MLRRRRPADDSRPDWSEVTSRDAALALVQAGRLEPLLLLPEQFGGDDRPENVVYVPRGFNDLRDRYLTDVVIGLVEDGTVDHFNATPEYRGDSFVPSAIVVELSHSQRPGAVTQRLEVW